MTDDIKNQLDKIRRISTAIAGEADFLSNLVDGYGPEDTTPDNVQTILDTLEEIEDYVADLRTQSGWLLNLAEEQDAAEEVTA